MPPVVERLAAPTWALLRRSVVSHGGATVAAAYARHVAAMRPASRPSSAFRREAVNGLNIVDELEGVFSH